MVRGLVNLTVWGVTWLEGLSCWGEKALGEWPLSPFFSPLSVPQNHLFSDYLKTLWHLFVWVSVSYGWGSIQPTGLEFTRFISVIPTSLWIALPSILQSALVWMLNHRDTMRGRVHRTSFSCLTPLPWRFGYSALPRLFLWEARLSITAFGGFGSSPKRSVRHLSLERRLVEQLQQNQFFKCKPFLSSWTSNEH